MDTITEVVEILDAEALRSRGRHHHRVELALQKLEEGDYSGAKDILRRMAKRHRRSAPLVTSLFTSVEARRNKQIADKYAELANSL